MFNIFSRKTASQTEVVNKVINNTPTYMGVKVSETTYNYFSNATEHFANAGQAAANCGMYATLTATHATQTAMQGILGLCAYKEFSGYLMTGHAFGFAVPAVVGGILQTIATTMVSHPTAFMLGFVGAAVAASPENAVETLKNAVYTGVEAANFTYENATGILNAAAGIGHLVYDNLPSFDASYDISSDAVLVAGALATTTMLAIEG